MAERIDNITEFINEYCKMLHLANMPAQVRARFDKYAKNKDFIGNMKTWPDLLDKELPELSDDKLKSLYNLFQSVFENMAQNQYAFKDKTTTTKAFFEHWYGNTDDKLFCSPQPITDVQQTITNFTTTILENPTYKSNLERIFKRYNVLPSDIEYDSFISDIKSEKYLTDPKLREQLLSVVNYVQDYSTVGDINYWPNDPNFTYDFTTSGLPADTNEWFKTTYNPGFKFRQKELFNKLLTSPVVFNDFKSYDYKGVISGQIDAAINATNYANKESKDFVPPLYEDKKNIFQKADDKLKKFNDNFINPVIHPLSGRRRFFSTYARNIVEAIESVKLKDKDGNTQHIKPTDGLKAILDNKDNIRKKLIDKSPKSTAHFDWITNKLEVYSRKMPTSFNGALSWPKHLCTIRNQLIVDAIQEGKIDECKSAMEMLYSMKYSFFDSKTMDAFKKTDMTILSDSGFSWNKYAGIRTFTKIVDGIGKVGLHLAGRVVSMIRNTGVQWTTKFGGNANGLDKAYNQWNNQNNPEEAKNTIAQFNDAINALEKEIKELEKSASGITPEAEEILKAKQDDKAMLEKQKQALEASTDETKWAEDHKDKYKEMMAFWDMLESYRKSHQFTFWTATMRDNFLKTRDDGKTNAQEVSEAFLKNYKMKTRNP